MLGFRRSRFLVSESSFGWESSWLSIFSQNSASSSPNKACHVKAWGQPERKQNSIELSQGALQRIVHSAAGLLHCFSLTPASLHDSPGIMLKTKQNFRFYKLDYSPLEHACGTTLARWRFFWPPTMCNKQRKFMEFGRLHLATASCMPFWFPLLVTPAQACKVKRALRSESISFSRLSWLLCWPPKAALKSIGKHLVFKYSNHLKSVIHPLSKTAPRSSFGWPGSLLHLALEQEPQHAAAVTDLVSLHGTR